MDLFRKYWLAGVILLLGAALTFYVGFRSESATVILWSGATVGILTGIAVGAARRDSETPTPPRKR